MNTPKIVKQTFQVNFDFDLIYTSKLFEIDNDILLNLISNKNTDTPSKAIMIVDSGVTKAHSNLNKNILNYFETHKKHIVLQGDIVEIPGGEQSKNETDHIKNILELVNSHGIDRHSYIIVIGGGALLDAVGFAAAISHRGVRLIRVPTTILSQNDSGIGVKNGINAFGKKNFVGSFAVPYAVINDDSFLTTLDIRDWRSGISEAIKVALIKDYAFFEWIETNVNLLNSRDKKVMNELIYRCANLHMDHIKNSGDAFELGSSRPLDFGHWSAHKLEQLSNYEIRHGEAVAVGIAIDTAYSYLKGHLSEAETTRVLDCIVDLGFIISYKEVNESIIKGLDEFREHLGGRLTIMLLESLGKGFEVNDMDAEIVMKSIEYIKAFYTKKIG